MRQNYNIFGVFSAAARSRWMIAAILVAAGLIRLGGINAWSLWEDEETSIFFSQQLEKPFAQCFPLFFASLNGLYRLTGISIVAGRALAGTFGLLSIWLTYVVLRKYASREAGLVAALLLTCCLGHVFWSQSIRYYTFLLAVEVLALLMFLDGFEECKYWKLVLSGVLIGVSMLIHFTAVLLVPVCIGYLFLVFISRNSTGAYGWKGCLAVGVPALLGTAFLLPRFLALQTTAATGTSPPVQYPLPLMIRIAAYYGVPMVGLALLALFYWRRFPPRVLLFLLAVGVIPILEIMVLGVFRLANVTWYHGFVAIVGFAGLAGMALAGVYKAGRRKTAGMLLLATAVYYVTFLCLYYTTMHGDRPRWGEASEFLQEVAQIDAAAEDNPAIFATVPGIVAHYLGVEPGRTMGHRLVRGVPDDLTSREAVGDEWYLLKASQVPDDSRAWFSENCVRVAEFEARTGPVNRTVLVYYRWKNRADYDRTMQRVSTLSDRTNVLKAPFQVDRNTKTQRGTS